MTSSPFNNPSFDPQFSEQFERVRDWLRRRLPRLVPIGPAVLALIWLATGIYVVRPGQVGVVRTFGRETGRTEPGLNYRFPCPVQQVDVVRTEHVRRIEVGLSRGKGVPEDAQRDDPSPAGKTINRPQSERTST